MIKYRTDCNSRIEEREVIKETSKQVIAINKYDGRHDRELRFSGYASWHDTEEEARAYLLSIQEKLIADYTCKISHSVETISAIKKFKTIRIDEKQAIGKME